MAGKMAGKPVVTPSPVAFDEEFERMLETREIPSELRQQMRELKPDVKKRLLLADVSPAKPPAKALAEIPSPNKKSRPRNRTFTFKRSDKENSVGSSSPTKKQFTFKRSDKEVSVGTSSPTKKQKTDSVVSLSAFPQPPQDGSENGLSSITSSSKDIMSRFRIPAAKANPKDYAAYLHEHSAANMELPKVHKLRQLLRNEDVEWVNTFITAGGMTHLVTFLYELMAIEWREERDDQLLNEALQCLKALCTTGLGIGKLYNIEDTLFPALLAMLFDKERRGPSDFTTRQMVFNIMLASLKSTVPRPGDLPVRARKILGYLSNQTNPDKRNPLPFDVEVGPKRGYKIWNKEVFEVAREVFWIWIHPLNVIPYPRSTQLEALFPPESYDSTHHPQGINIKGANETIEDPYDFSINSPGLDQLVCKKPRIQAHPSQQMRKVSCIQYTNAFFPRPRPPVPAAPYIGGVEWDATNYLAAHLDLMNGLLASLPNWEERNSVRAELRDSGFENTMADMLRKCNEKYYAAIHDVLRTWVAAAVCDGWDVKLVRNGPSELPPSPKKTRSASPKKSPQGKKKQQAPPQLPEVTRLDGGKVEKSVFSGEFDVWGTGGCGI